MKPLHSLRFPTARACARLASLALLGIVGLAGRAQAQTYGDLLDFNSTNGAAPTGAMAVDSAGNKYQAVAFGSNSNGGLIVKWTPAGVMSVVHSFTGTITYANGSTGADGGDPAGVTLDGNGNLFGVAQNGGANRSGLVFEITAAGQYFDLHDFGGTVTNANGASGADGQFPVGPVAIDRNGNLYGAASNGGPNRPSLTANGAGMIWEITAGGAYKDLHDFGATVTYSGGGAGIDGLVPQAGVTVDAAGDVFGTTTQGGPNYNAGAFTSGSGLVWEIPFGSAYKDLHDFGKSVTLSNGTTGTDGGSPNSLIAFDATGDMFGLTGGGGLNGGGVIWEITSGHVYKDLHDFGGSGVQYANGSVAKDGTGGGAGMVVDSVGNLIGVTANGGPNYTTTFGTYGAYFNQGGTLWELSAAGSYQVLHAFGGQVANANGTTGWDGQAPNLPTLDAAGNIWGSTFAGGPNGVPNTTLPVPRGYGMMWEVYYGSLSAVSVSPTSVVGGASPTGTVTLTGAASPSGSLVSLSSNTSYATVPLSVTVPAGQSSTTFAVTTFGTTTVTTATITAAMAGVTHTATLTINPASTLTISLNPASVVGGATSVGTVTLSTPAGVNGALVNLSSNSAYATVPASVFVYAGALSQSFTVNTSVVSSTTTATLTAKLGTASATTILTINPTSVSVLSVSPTSVFGLTSSTGSVVLSGPAPVGGKIVYLTSSNSCATVPTYVFIPTGASSGNFTITTTTVSFDTAVTITGNLNNVKTNATLTVRAAVLNGITLANYGQAFGPGSTTATVTLNGPAGAAGAVVNLSSNSSVAKVPASVYFTPGSSSATVAITLTAPSGNPQTVTITATQGAQTYPASLTVNAPVITGLTIAPSSVMGGQSAVGTVTIPPMPNTTTVNLSSNNACATIPATATGGDGTYAVFTIQTTSVTALTTVTITASQGSKSYSATLVVAPDGVAGLTLSPTSVAGGQISTATLTLDKAAPTYGLVVNLTSSNTAAATVPASVYVAAGATKAVFTVSTYGVYSATSVTISAAFDGTTSTAVLTVNPVMVTSVTVSPTSVKGGVNSTGTVTLNAPAGPYGAVVNLSSNSANATVPSYVFVGAGATTAKFTVSTTAVAATTTACITATTGSTSAKANLTVTH